MRTGRFACELVARGLRQLDALLHSDMHAACRSILWAPIWNGDRPGLEHLLLRDGSADSVILTFDEQGRPFRIAYQLAWDGGWRLHRAQLSVANELGTRTLTLEADGQGSWRDGEGVHVAKLDGCVDIDIWPTPFTNTFPLRRQPLAVGEQRDFMMAWVSAPELIVEPVRQRYTRLAERRYSFESLDGSGFRAELPVDDEHLIVDYEGTFRRIR